MHKILFTNPRIGSYSVFLLLGIVSGYVLTRWRARRAGISPAHIENVTLLFDQHRILGLIPPNATTSLPVHPVQLYEAGLAFVLCAFLLRRPAHTHWAGRTFCLLLLNYGFIRFATEFFRADNPPAYAGLTLSQVISLILVLTAGSLLMRKVPATPSSSYGPTVNRSVKC